MKRGEFEAKLTATNKLMGLKSLLYAFTTMHQLDFQAIGKVDKTGKYVLKSTQILEYNKNMGYEDKTDMLLSSTGTVRKSIKWHNKLFFHVLDMALLN